MQINSKQKKKKPTRKPLNDQQSEITSVTYAKH